MDNRERRPRIFQFRWEQGRWCLFIRRPEGPKSSRLCGRLSPALNPVSPFPLPPLSFTWPCKNLLGVGGKTYLIFIKVKRNSPSFFSILKSSNKKLLSLFHQIYEYVVSPHRKQISLQDSHCILQILIFSLAFYFHFYQLLFCNPTLDSHSF